MSNKLFSILYGIMILITTVVLLIAQIRYKQDREKKWKWGAACLGAFVVIDCILHALVE